MSTMTCSTAPYAVETPFERCSADLSQMLSVAAAGQAWVVLQTAINKAEQRYMRRTGESVTSDEKEILDCLYPLCRESVPMISFLDDKIKVKITLDGVLYILDFDRYDRNAAVLIGRYENDTYTVSRSKRNELVKITECIW